MENTPKEESPIVTIVCGLLMIAGAIWLFIDISGKEAAGGTLRLTAILMLFYNIGGKWLISGVVGIAGIAIAAAGIRKKLQA